jgi:hypothetical protein
VYGSTAASICDPTPLNESICAFEKSDKMGKVKKKNCFYMMYFVKIYQLRYPDMTTALQTYYDINGDWHTFFLEAIAFPLFEGIPSNDFYYNGRVSSQLCQISINSYQVSGKLRHVISSISSC